MTTQYDPEAETDRTSDMPIRSDPAGLPRNPHSVDALAVYDVDSNTAAIVASNLAVAYELRTANLIAVVATNGSVSTALREEIADRLALNSRTSDPL